MTAGGSAGLHMLGNEGNNAGGSGQLGAGGFGDYGRYGTANDAINTIIRQDEDTETGEFLSLCVEGNIVLVSLQSVELNLEIMLLGCSHFQCILAHCSS
ncbi:hypothetical protein C1H46_044730 [Malus baccata]|uniref:Uncharacterized protein n=1 Tax=Malus baccata TaxID=106549 RepID=A0A540K683_MALBA|nr:hypothetical protein C1H46_044730 [Malus baccata]